MSGREAAFRPSPQQEQMWTAEPRGPAGIVQAVVAIDGAIANEALRTAIDRITVRHEILRTTFARRSGIRVPLQVVRDGLAPHWEMADLPALAADREAAVNRFAADERRAALDLERGPLLRIGHAEVGPQNRLLVITGSPLCLDAATLPVFLAELAAQLGIEIEIPVDPLQYADYAEWQHEMAAGDGDDATAGRRHWEKCGEPSSPKVPFAGASAETEPTAVPVPYDDAVARSVSELARRYGSTCEDVVHAAWHALLARLTGAADVTTVLIGEGLGQDNLDGLIGPISRRLAIRTKVPAEATFAELMTRVMRARADALRWDVYAPSSAADGLRVGFTSSAGFDVEGNGVRVSLVDLRTQPDVGLWLTCHDLVGTPRLQLTDDGALPRAQVERLAGELGRIIRSAAGDAGTPTGGLNLLSEDERHELLAGFNDTAIAVTPPSVQERFAAHAHAHPEATAVQDGVTSLTYAELESRAGRLANGLRALGVKPGDVVGLCTDRSVEMAVGLLAILEARAGFLPLHFDHPRARLTHQLSEAGCRVLVTQSPLRDRLPTDGLDIICVDDGELPSGAPETATAGAPRGEDLAYVIYTSGSTGRPKGVGVTNANLANYVDHIVRELRAGERPLSFAMVTALSTDLGHTAVFPALCSGGTLTLVPPSEAGDAASLARRLDKTPVDVMKLTPSHLGALLSAGDGRILPRQTLVIGGERLGWDLVERVRQLGSCVVVNHYGPTETTVGSCMFTVPDGPGPFAPASVPIGRPISNTRCYVLDAWAEPVPIGAPGGLFIAGAGVAHGYIGQPELTAERFSPDPFVPDGGSMYETGDLTRWLPDGTLEYLGRADQQVKIRGFRVEPGEVEDVLRAHPLVREAAVVAGPDALGSPRLIAYVAHESSVDHQELAAHLIGLLPDYMVPGVYVTLDALPLTPSGKVDRLALPEPGGPGTGGDDGWVEPRTALEQAIATIWSDVLHVERIGVEEDFFALGGHSLLAAQVVAQVRSDFAVELPMHSLFTLPTVASLSAEIGRLIETVDEAGTAELLAKLENLSDEQVSQMLAEHSSLDEG